jgi:hypothetical protein
MRVKHSPALLASVNVTGGSPGAELVTPWPNILYALDLTKPGARVKWS